VPPVGDPGEVRLDPQGGLTTPALVLGAGTAAANALAYVTAAVLARATGPAVYGELAALVALGIIGNVPATALQLVVARRTAAAGTGRDLRGIRAAAVTTAGLLLICVLLSPLLNAALDLHGLTAPLVLGLTLVPQTLTGALFGDLLGRSAYGRLATAYVLAAAGRLVAAGTVAALGGSVVQILLAVAGAGVLTLFLTVLLCGLHRPVRSLTAAEAPPWRELVGAGAVTGGVLVLTNLDLLMARAFLEPSAAGAYAVGSLFAKAAFWAPNFVTVLVYPRLASGTGVRRALVRAMALTVAIGGVIVLVTALTARPIISATSGSEYLDHATYPVTFAVLGALFALAQLLLLSSVAMTDRRAEGLVWVAIAVEAVAMSLNHGSGAAILAVAVSINLLLVLAGLVLRRRDLVVTT
jgi:O-antigen/teichoic acid export membrane protein